MSMPSDIAAAVAWLLVLAALGQLYGFADVDGGVTSLLLTTGIVLGIVGYVSDHDHRGHPH